MEIDMLSNAKIALSLAPVATASGAMAAPKHAVRHHSARAHSAVAWQMPATSYQSFGSMTGSRRGVKPTYMNSGDIIRPYHYPDD
jgi:hypothetical protein